MSGMACEGVDVGDDGVTLILTSAPNIAFAWGDILVIKESDDGVVWTDVEEDGPVSWFILQENGTRLAVNGGVNAINLGDLIGEDAQSGRYDFVVDYEGSCSHVKLDCSAMDDAKKEQCTVAVGHYYV